MHRSLASIVFLGLPLALLAGCAEEAADDSGSVNVAECGDGANPLVGSCLDTWLQSCFAPDLEGECTDSGAAVSWSDGHHVDRTGASPGFYGPDDAAPCVSFTYDMGTGVITYTDGDQTATDEPLGGGEHLVTCPDGSTFEYSDEEGVEFNLCRGVMCP